VELQQGWHYDVARDGRFLIDTVMDSAAAPITLLMNWNPNAKRQPRGPDKSSLVALGLGNRSPQHHRLIPEGPTDTPADASA
jgi:hypothetical protein